MRKPIVPLSTSESSSLPSEPNPDARQENSPLIQSSQASSIYGGIAGSNAAMPETPAHLQNPRTSSTFPVEEVGNTSNWSTSLQTVLDQPPSALPRQLMLSGLAFCVAFGAWATFGQIDEVGHAQGRLVPKGEPYKIHPVVSGKVARIDIKEGQVVKAGQVLFELDSQIAANEVQRLQQEQVAEEIELLQIQSLIDKTLLESQTHAAMTKADSQAQSVAIAQANDKAEGQQAAIAEAQEKAATTRKLLSQFQTEVIAYHARLARLKPLVQQGALGTEQVFEAEQALREKERNITQSQGELQQTLAKLAQLQAERKQALAEPNRLQAELAQKQAQGSTDRIEQEQKIQQLQVQKTQLRAKVGQTQNQLTKAKAELKQLALTAPVDGVILSLNVRNSGEVIQPGQTIAEMAPQEAPLILSASLPTREAGFVKPGMPVQIKLDAYPYQNYGIFTGKLLAISPDTKPDERLGAVYRVEVALAHKYVTTYHQTIQLKAGQTATAEIVIRHRRIIDILLDPIEQMQKGGVTL